MVTLSQELEERLLDLVAQVRVGVVVPFDLVNFARDLVLAGVDTPAGELLAAENPAVELRHAGHSFPSY